MLTNTKKKLSSQVNETKFHLFALQTFQKEHHALTMEVLLLLEIKISHLIH